MVENRWDLWRSSGPTPLLKQVHPELLVQDHIQKAFEKNSLVSETGCQAAGTVNIGVIYRSASDAATG